MQILLPEISDAECTPLVRQLLEIIFLLPDRIQQLEERIRQLEDEIARLKGLKARPQIAPSTLETPPRPPREPAAKRPGSAKRSKTAELTITAEKVIRLVDKPPGSIFKGYEDFVVENLVLRPRVVRYRRERWVTPDGQNLVAPLPAEVPPGSHFGPDLICFILHQYHHQSLMTPCVTRNDENTIVPGLCSLYWSSSGAAPRVPPSIRGGGCCRHSGALFSEQHVTQLLLLEQLHQMGLDISTGELSRILTEGKDAIHQERAELLPAASAVSPSVQVDDTGARHQGHNGSGTHVGNEWFTSFASTESKSRLNFLEILRRPHIDYQINEHTVACWRRPKLAATVVDQLRRGPQAFADTAAWQRRLRQLEITRPRQVRGERRTDRSPILGRSPCALTGRAMIRMARTQVAVQWSDFYPTVIEVLLLYFCRFPNGECKCFNCRILSFGHLSMCTRIEGNCFHAQPMLAYFGPDTFMPVASIVGAVGGALMIFGRTIFCVASRSVRLLFRKSPRVP
jgi:hypothetical protein